MDCLPIELRGFKNYHFLIFELLISLREKWVEENQSELAITESRRISENDMNREFKTLFLNLVYLAIFGNIATH